MSSGQENGQNGQVDKPVDKPVDKIRQQETERDKLIKRSRAGHRAWMTRIRQMEMKAAGVIVVWDERPAKGSSRGIEGGGTATYPRRVKIGSTLST